MSTDPEKIGPKTNDPLFFIRPETPSENKKMQETLRECDKIMGISDKKKEQEGQEEDELESAQENQESQEEVQETRESGGDNRRWVDIEGVAKHGSFKVSAIRYWIRLTSIAKSNILSVGPHGGRILSELIKQGIIYNVSSTGIRVKANLDEKETIVKEIAKSDFDKIWAILQELRHVIPFHKQGKLIRFDLQEIDPWMKRKEVDN